MNYTQCDRIYCAMYQVVDVPVDHPSCSSQHAVLQYRLVDYEKKDGSTGKRVRYAKQFYKHID